MNESWSSRTKSVLHKVSEMAHSFRTIKIIAISIALLSIILFIENKSILPTHSSQVSIYFLDSLPKHMRRTNHGMEVVSPAMWKAYILIEGKSVVCDIPSALYQALKSAPNDQRIGLLSYHHALFSDGIVCEQLDPVMNQK